jgi:hypothetical protein
MTNIGLLLIVGAWLFQYLHRDDRIQTFFMLFYMLGVIFLVIDALSSGSFTLAVLNLCAFGASGLVLTRVYGGKSTVKRRK